VGGKDNKTTKCEEKTMAHRELFLTIHIMVRRKIRGETMKLLGRESLVFMVDSGWLLGMLVNQAAASS